jgi:hypothetical protein
MQEIRVNQDTHTVKSKDCVIFLFAFLSIDIFQSGSRGESMLKYTLKSSPPNQKHTNLWQVD